MYKLVNTDSFLAQDEPSIRLLDDFKDMGFVKKAEADDRITAYAKTIQPDPTKIYVHIIALGAGETWGANRNADFFPRDSLIRDHGTFHTNPAHFFRHHQNRKKEIAMGEVVYSIFNPRMSRVELIAWLDREKAKDIVEKIERGEFPSTSMAMKIPSDTCSICGNVARSRDEYCSHLSHDLGRIYPDGRKVMAINEVPASYFDISYVIKPADITSSVLQKLASDANMPVVGSAEAAEEIQLQEKKASHKKFSELIKEVEGQIDASADSLESLLAKIQDPPEEVIKYLSHYDLNHTLHALAELGVSPSIAFFSRLIGHKMCGEAVPGIEHLVHGMMHVEPESIEVDTDVSEMHKAASVHPRVQIIAALIPFAKQASLFPNMAMERAFNPMDYPPQYPVGQIGFSGQGPAIAPDPADMYRALRAQTEPETHGLLKTLLRIAIAAISAKYLVSKMIDAKMQERLMQQEHSIPSIKISLSKSASDSLTTQKLVKAELLRSLKA